MHHLSYGYSKIKIRLYTSSDGNGIMFAPMCKADVDGKCFTSTNEKICEHKVNAVKLDTVGDFVVFPSRFYHRGYYRIASDMTYYTAKKYKYFFIFFWRVDTLVMTVPSRLMPKARWRNILGCLATILV